MVGTMAGAGVGADPGPRLGQHDQRMIVPTELFAHTGRGKERGAAPQHMAAPRSPVFVVPATNPVKVVGQRAGAVPAGGPRSSTGSAASFFFGTLVFLALYLAQHGAADPLLDRLALPGGAGPDAGVQLVVVDVVDVTHGAAVYAPSSRPLTFRAAPTP